MRHDMDSLLVLSSGAACTQKELFPSVQALHGACFQREAAKPMHLTRLLFPLLFPRFSWIGITERGVVIVTTPRALLC